MTPPIGCNFGISAAASVVLYSCKVKSPSLLREFLF
jgi:hypothetical protein